MIGCHISEIIKTYPKVAQIYTHKLKPYEEYPHIPDLIKDLHQSESKFYIHSTFCTVPGNSKFNFFFITQLRYAVKHGAAGLVVHIPNIEQEEVVGAFRAIKGEINQKDTIVYLEHIPGMYACPEILKSLYSQISELGMNFGICIDTCHIYSSGYDLGDEKVMEDYLETISSIGCPVLVHLNDSVGDLGSHVDRHNAIGTKIWSKNKWQSLALLLKKSWDCILEMDQQKYIESMKFVNYVLDMSKDDKE